MSSASLTCPRCKATRMVKNGKIHHRRQNFKCKACSRQFVQNSPKKVIGLPRDLIDKLLLERLSQAGLPQSYRSIRTMVTDLPQYSVSSTSTTSWSWVEKKGRLTIQCDQMWSSVGNKGNKQWEELALEWKSGEIVGCIKGDRGDSAHRLWHWLPSVYKQCAVYGGRFWRGFLSQWFLSPDIALLVTRVVRPA